MTYASEAGSNGPSSRACDSSAMRGQSVSRQTCVTADAGTTSRRRDNVSRIVAPQSESMYSSRSAGNAGSSGTYAPPAFRMPSSPTSIALERSVQIATRESRRTQIELAVGKRLAIVELRGDPSGVAARVALEQMMHADLARIVGRGVVPLG